VKVLSVIIQIALLFIVYEIGVFVQNLFGLFVPGSVIGLVLMFVLLTTGVLHVRFIEEGARFMIRHLVLFFIPATVGIMSHYELFAGKGVLLFFITILSTCIVMAGSGLVSQLLQKKGVRDHA
jgi:holin-like protein